VFRRVIDDRLDIGGEMDAFNRELLGRRVRVAVCRLRKRGEERKPHHI
jgi:hypothetical protein